MPPFCTRKCHRSILDPTQKKISAQRLNPTQPTKKLWSVVLLDNHSRSDDAAVHVYRGHKVRGDVDRAAVLDRQQRPAGVCRHRAAATYCVVALQPTQNHTRYAHYVRYGMAW